MTTILANGTGETLGGAVATAKPLVLSGNVWYVQSTNGVDAASPAGKDKEKPLATMAQAQTNASDGDVVILLQNHTETFTSALSITKKLVISAAGQSAGKPTVKLYGNSAASGVLSFTVDGCELENVWFPENVQSNSAVKVTFTSAVNCRIADCYFECGAFDAGNSSLTVLSGCTGMRVENCYLISTATGTTTRAPRGLYINGALSDVVVTGTTFSDGVYGFSTAAFDASASALVRCKFMGISLLLGADAIQHTSTTGRFNFAVNTGGGRVSF